MKKRAVITGCSSGIGYALTRSLLLEGWEVCATLRNAEERLHLFKELKEQFPSLRIESLDVESDQDCQRLGEIVQSDWSGRLDVAVINAGFGIFGAIEQLTTADLIKQFEVNVFGAHRTLLPLLPALRASKGRIIGISSALARLAPPFTGAYAASKGALEAMFEALYFEMAPFEVQVCLVEPGLHYTKFGANSIWKESPEKGELYQVAANRHKKMLSSIRTGDGGDSPQRVADRVCRLLQMSKMPLRCTVGGDALLLDTLRKLLPEALFLALFQILYLRRAKNTDKI